MKLKHVFGIIILLLAADQALKFYVKTHFHLYDEHFVIRPWFRLYFIENEGMAYGATFGDGSWAKLALTLFRLTGVKMFTTKGHEQNTGDGKINRVLKKLIKNPFALIVVTLAVTDVVFALDSIPAILAISTIPLVAYGSNIFAVMGLRSLFFLLKGAVDRFRYLQQGVAAVLVFIGAKMLAGMIPLHLPEWASLLVIAACLGGSILLSIKKSPT